MPAISHSPDVDLIELLLTARRSRGLSRRQIWLSTQIHPDRLFRLEHRLARPRPTEITKLIAVLLPEAK